MVFAPGDVDLCCLGDSITQKFEWQDAFPSLRVANRGIGSDTTEGMLARTDSIAALHPGCVSVMAGINDLALGHAPDEIVASYRELLLALQREIPDVRVIVSCVLPVSAARGIRTEDILAVNVALEALCGELGIVYLDLFPLFADADGHLLPEYSLDGVHLTPAGYQLWLSHLAPALSEE